MAYKIARVAEAAELLKKRMADSDGMTDVLKSIELKALFDELKTLPSNERASFGQEVNALKLELEALIASRQSSVARLAPIDVTAPMDVNAPRPELLPSEIGSIHPLTRELDTVLDIFYRMSFSAVESRGLDDDWHMFTSLNFPEDHPARDDYDTFSTVEGLIAPAHTSTMQNRVLTQYKASLERGEPVACVIPGRVFRNEDLDARHEHTFYQFEGVYVDQNLTVGNLIATLKTFFETYYGKTIEVRTQPFYFPFTEPSLEFAIACPFCDKKGCSICGEGWLEMLGCGAIHPNVLKMAGIDPLVYTGFAWGGGIERLVMIKYGIEDIRHFHSANLNFLRQFA